MKPKIALLVALAAVAPAGPGSDAAASGPRPGGAAAPGRAPNAPDRHLHLRVHLNLHIDVSVSARTGGLMPDA